MRKVFILALIVAACAKKEPAPDTTTPAPPPPPPPPPSLTAADVASRVSLSAWFGAAYSCRSTATGSMRAARHAGIQLAAIATTPSVTAVPR